MEGIESGVGRKFMKITGAFHSWYCYKDIGPLGLLTQSDTTPKKSAMLFSENMALP